MNDDHSSGEYFRRHFQPDDRDERLITQLRLLWSTDVGQDGQTLTTTPSES